MTENGLIPNGEFDAPRLPTETDISSLGLNWPPNYAGSFERVRAAYPALLENEQQLQQIISIQKIAFNNQRRSVIKAVARKEFVQQWLPTDAIEAAPIFSMKHQDLCLVYFAANPPGRELQAPVSIRAIPAYLEKRKENNQRFQNLNQGHLTAAVEHIVKQFSVCRANSQYLDKLTDLYHVFGWNQAEIAKLIESPANKIYLAIQENVVAGAVMIEQNNWPVDQFGLINIAELTEGVVRPKFRGNGLIVGLSIIATEDFINHDGQLIYAEDNILTTGGLGFKVGRSGSIANCQGILRAHVQVEDGSGDQLGCFYPSIMSTEDGIRWGYGIKNSHLNQLINQRCNL